MLIRRWTPLLALCMFPVGAAAQTPDSTKVTTLSGIYTAAQATAGKDVYAASCQSCHAVTELSGSSFWNGYIKRPLSELFGYIRNKMPNDNPASLSDVDYVNVTAYVLQLNTMPAGGKELVADTTALFRILVVPPDTTKKPGSSSPPSHLFRHTTGNRK